MASPRTRSSGSDSAGTTLGTVTGLDPDGGVYLELPRVAAGYQYGPALSTVAGLAVGDSVVVGFIDDNPDTPVVLGRIGGP